MDSRLTITPKAAPSSLSSCRRFPHLGQTRPWRHVRVEFVLPPTSDIGRHRRHGSFVPKAAIGPKVPVSRCTHGLSPLPRDLSVILFEH